MCLNSGTDSKDFEQAWNIGKSHDPALTAAIQELWSVVIPANIVLDIYWLDTKANWHADGLTRPTGTDRETKLLPHLFQRVHDTHGPFDLDAMASAATAQRPQGSPQPPCMSRYYDSAAIAVDVFLTPHLQSLGHCHCFPPHAVMGSILALMLENNVTCTMVIVDRIWQAATAQHTTPPWWPLATQAASSITLFAPANTPTSLAFHKGTWKPCHPTPAATYVIHLPGSAGAANNERKKPTTSPQALQ